MPIAFLDGMRLLVLTQAVDKGNSLVNALGKHHHYIRWARTEAQAELLFKQHTFDGVIVLLTELKASESSLFSAFIQQRIKLPILQVDSDSMTESIIKELHHLSHHYLLNQYKQIPYGGLIFEPESCLVRDKQSIIFLSPKESLLLEKLLKNVGKAVTKMELLHALGSSINDNPNKVEVFICNVRKKLPSIVIETVYSMGYRIMPFVEAP